MKLVRGHHNTCGQACIATICGLTLEQACTMMKTKGITRTKQLVEALRKCDRQCADKLTRGFPSDNESAILLWTHPDGRKHWTIWHKKKYYDPHAGVFRKRPDYLAESRVTSHLKITL